MRNFFLSKVRLTFYYPIFFVFFIVVLSLAPKQQLSGSQLTLFSVNSFLLAFYLGPILNGQKSRIDDLAKSIRNEAMALFNVSILCHDLQPKTRHQLKGMIRDYLLAAQHSHKPAEGEKEYEALLRFCIDYEGKDAEGVKKVREALIKNEENRSAISVGLKSGVFSHEWFVLLVLFTITLSYIVVIDLGGSLLLTVIAALLCTGLSLLLLILAKLAALTHKKAKTIWLPFDRLLATDFKHIEQ